MNDRGETSRSMTTSRALNRFLSSIILVALGIIGGFGVFHFSLQQKIQRTERSRNTTFTSITNRLAGSEKERSQCIERDDGRLQEISDLRGRLDAQYKSWYDLTAAQRSDQRTLASLRAESEQKDRDLIAIKVDSDECRRAAEDRDLELSKIKKGIEKNRIQMQQKDLEIDALQSEKRSLEHGAIEMRDEMNKMESQIIESNEELSKYRAGEGKIETKLTSFREGMLGVLNEKIQEIQDLKSNVDLLNQEKMKLEQKLENWREGLLNLLKEKIQEIEQLKAELSDSHKSMKSMMDEIDIARSEQNEAEEFIRVRLDSIDQNSNTEQDETIQELLQEIERVREELRDSHEWVVAALKEIELRKSDQAKSEEQIIEKTKEIDKLRLEIETDQKSANEEISKLRESAEGKKEEIDYLNSELNKFVFDVNKLKSVFSGASAEPNGISASSATRMMIDHVQQRDSVMCRQLFGKGPYYVKFIFRLSLSEASGGRSSGGENNHTAYFVLELSSRKELPHSTYTFLTLVESNLYNDGVAVLSARDGVLKVGSIPSPDGISLEQKLKPLGLTGGSSLSFVETSISGENPSCGQFSFGFAHRGPGLNIYLSKENERMANEGGNNCFAKVIRGQENLEKLLKNGEPLEIISAKHLRVE